jgi:hypothetical protein
VAKIIPNGKQKGFENGESTVVILNADSKKLNSYDFSSDDGTHGYGVDGAQWTLDSDFFVFRMRSSGGHSPMNAPVFFWSRANGDFYELQNYTGDILFSVSGGDELQLSTLSDMRPVSLSLKNIKPEDAVPLKPLK